VETQALTQALQALTATQQTLTWLASLQTVLLAGLVLIGVISTVVLVLELRALRQMILAVQTSAERIAEMTRDILRRV